MAWLNKQNLILLFVVIVILGCIAAIVAPAIVVNGNSKIAPIVIGSVLLVVILGYIIWKAPSNIKWFLLPLFYFGGLLGGMIGIGISDIDEGAKIASILLLSLLFLLSIVIVFSYTGPKGEKYVSGIMYLILITGLIASLAIVGADVTDMGSVKVLTLICLGIILGLTILLGFFSLKNNALGKFNFLGLNPKIQIDKIKSWGINKTGAGVMLLVLIVTVVMLYIGGSQFIDVYKNTTSKSDFDKNFALIWAILNFVVAAWITIQTIYFIVALGMMFYEDAKNKCIEKVKEDIDEKTGLPRNVEEYFKDKNGNLVKSEGKLGQVLDEFDLAYSSTDPTKTGYVNTINQPGKINENGIFIPSEFLDADGENVRNDSATRLALIAYLDNHRKAIANGENPVIPTGVDVRRLIDFTINELKNGGTSDDIIARLREEFETVGGQAVTFRTAEAARAAAEERANLAERQECAAREEAGRRLRESETARADRLRAIQQADQALLARDEALAAAIRDQRLAAEEGVRARQTIAAAEGRAAGREAQADFNMLQATRRTREADERVRRAEAAINRQRTELEAAIANEQNIAAQSRNAIDRYNQSRDAIERERAELEVRVLNERRNTAIAEGARCNQRILALRGELNTEIARLQDSVRDLETSLGTVREERDTNAGRIRAQEQNIRDLTISRDEAERISQAADEAAARANRRAENLLREARTNATLRGQTEQARDEALRARAEAQTQSERAQQAQRELEATLRTVEDAKIRAQARIALAEEGAVNAAEAAGRALTEAEGLRQANAELYGGITEALTSIINRKANRINNDSTIAPSEKRITIVREILPTLSSSQNKFGLTNDQILGIIAASDLGNFDNNVYLTNRYRQIITRETGGGAGGR